MTFAEIVSQTMSLMNLTSETAQTRVGKDVNRVYGQIVSAIGLETTAPGIVTATTEIGSRLLVFEGATKVFAIWNPNLAPSYPLVQVTLDEIRNSPIMEDPARRYAVYIQDADTVTVYLDSVPATEYDLTADVQLAFADLADDDVPIFPQDFHDMLVDGACAIEARKMEKLDVAADYQGNFDSQLAQLKYFLAKSKYLNVYQGRNRYWRGGLGVWPTTF